MVEITVPIPPGVVVPDDAVQVPDSFLIWRDGLEVHAVVPDGRHISDSFPTEEIAQLMFLNFAYLH